MTLTRKDHDGEIKVWLAPRVVTGLIYMGLLRHEPRICPQCFEAYAPTRSDQQYCEDRCRYAAKNAKLSNIWPDLPAARKAQQDTPDTPSPYCGSCTVT